MKSIKESKMIIATYKPKTLTLVIGQQGAELYIPPCENLYITFNEFGQILAWKCKPIFNDEENDFESIDYGETPTIIGRVDDTLTTYQKTHAFECFKLSDGNFEKHL